MKDFRFTTLPELLAGGFTGGFTFLMRHAERVPIRSREDVLEAGLTESGWEAARELGRHLVGRTRIGMVYSSPIGRCLDTAQALLQAALGGQVSGERSAVQLRWWLFSPFLQAPDGWSPNSSAVDIYHQQRMVARVPHHRLDMMLSRLKTPADSESIHLYVAHDTTVILALARLLGAGQVDSADYPGFMQGIALRREAGGLRLL